ncbi:MAG: tetratricopeptide repeat protein [Thiohalophilus sp.]|jgi:hypothetical protein
MIKFLHKVLAVVTVMMCIGLSTPALADAGQFKLDMILAKRGDADAMYYVANAYEEGRGTQKDMNQAFEWYSKAAKQDQQGAQYKLGVFYENGEAVQQDIKTAMEWYKKAAANGSTLAKERLNKAAFARSEEVMKRRIAEMQAEREKREAAKARARQAAERKQQQKKAAVQHKQVAAVVIPKPVPVKRISIPDIVDVVLKYKWQEGTQPADYLPSSSTHCLRASDSEVVCFSGEKQRVVNGMRVTYTTKATLNDFKPNGSFRVIYNYNVVKLDPVGTRGVAVDPHGLKLQEGWQKPRLAVNCQTRDRLNLYCARGGVKLHYRH